MSEKKKKNGKKGAQDPELFEHSYLEAEQSESAKHPPYIYLVLILFVILSFIWKSFVSDDKTDGQTAASVPHVPQFIVTKPYDAAK